MDKNFDINREPNGVIVYPQWMEDFIKHYFPQNPGKPQKPNEDNDKLKVNIKSIVEDEFVVVGDDDYLYATGRKVNQNGIFRIIMLDDNEVKIRQAGGDFIRVDNRDFLVADTDRKGATKFKMYKIADKEYVLQAPNGYYVRARDNDKRLVARAENPGNRTRFKFREVK
ncbi:hypothetical protein H8697_13505 [[Eubacterium] tenue]|nr:hypothetical protein [[Eubacterium] tenue]MBC8632703.1 hypothetical protein [[Eubacterium] tenue]